MEWREGLYALWEQVYIICEEDRQMTIEDFIAGDIDRNNSMTDLLQRLQTRYHLDFAGNLDKIYKADTLHRTVEYMRKHFDQNSK